MLVKIWMNNQETTIDDDDNWDSQSTSGDGNNFD